MLVLWPAEALAHAADRGFVLLLPTGYYAAGGAAAVALSFVILAFTPAGLLARLAGWRLTLPAILKPSGTETLRVFTSTSAFLLLAFLVHCGLAGSRDPLANPLPLTVWTLWWVGLTLIQGAVGPLWRWIEPWYGPWRLACLAAGRKADAPPPFRLPRGAGYSAAFLLFAAFAWFELVYPAPDDPARLALAVAAYWLFSFLAILVFGHGPWTQRAECFSLFFSMIARMAVIRCKGTQARPALALPGAGLARAAPLAPGGMLFLLLALSSVSFDGLMRTFFWFRLQGLNPLEFPGRSAVILPNTVGLLGMFGLLAGAFLAAVWLGERMAGANRPLARSAGALVWSIIPISLAYHFSHYLTALLVNGQYGLVALSDPLARGWNLFGTADMHVHAGVIIGHEASWWIWNAQAGAIILGHMLAVASAHVIALRLHGDVRSATLSQLPLAVLMVGYTVFGLWLLSTPTGV
jgi:hypothetical protein